MVLTVDFDGFAAATKSLTGANQAFVSPMGNGCSLTSAGTEKGLIVRSTTPLSMADAITQLKTAGIAVERGAWSEGSTDAQQDLWVAAVAYKSGEDSPGLWVSTYQEKPTTGEVLAALYEEFRETGDVGELPLEEFLRLAEPNVVILSPDQLWEFAAGREEDAANEPK
ncbi:MAG: hypothetical protein IH944_07860 [Armatimonadetes bacterium]|nr:hypothetical protein [Armatimonadota bacterium]